LRGLADYITVKIHPDYNYVYNLSGWNGFFVSCKTLMHIFSSKFGAVPLRLPDKFLFAGISLVMNFCLATGKYSTALKILKKRADSI